MSSQIERIQLQNSEQALAMPSFQQSEPAAIRQWLNKLSKEDPAYPKQLRMALGEIARIENPPLRTWVYTECLRPYIHQFIRQQLFDSRQPSNRLSKRIERSIQLLNDLALSYKSIVNRCIDSRENSLFNTLAESIHRCVSELSQILLLCSEFYYPAKGVWYEMHTIYRVAIKEDLTGYKPVNTVSGKNHSLAVDGVYKRSLLLDLATSGQLLARETQLTNKALTLWVSHVGLSYAQAGSHQCNADTLSDSGLKYSSLSDQESKQCLTLDHRILLRHLKKLQANYQKTKPGIPLSLIKHLINSWQPPKTRLFKRYTNNDHYEYALGFDAIYHCLNDKEIIETQFNPVEPEFSVNQEPTDIWASIYSKPVAPSHSQLPEIDFIDFRQHTTDSNNFKAYRAISINSSANGYCLQISKSMIDRIFPGEMVALREKGQKRWILARIKWLQHNEKNIRIGLEVTSSSVYSCFVRPLCKTDNQQPYEKAILILPNKSQPGKPALISRNRTLKKNMKFIFKTSDSSKRGVVLQASAEHPRPYEVIFRILEEQHQIL